MTQTHFAALMGKSLRWVEDLEAGRVQANPQLSVMLLAASKLGITLERLLSDEAVACAGQSELDAVRAALHRHDVITGARDDADDEPVPVDMLDRALEHARSGFQRGHFAQLGVSLPTLLVDGSQAAHHHRGDDQLEAFRLLSLSLELTEAALIKWGDTETALLAGHRAVAAAERSEDPVIMASAARHLADAMTMDRGKQGLKRSQLTDGYGIPVVTLPAGANLRDHTLLPDTLDEFAAVATQLEHLPQHPALSLDAGYDYQMVRLHRVLPRPGHHHHHRA